MAATRKIVFGHNKYAIAVFFIIAPSAVTARKDDAAAADQAATAKLAVSVSAGCGGRLIQTTSG